MVGGGPAGVSGGSCRAGASAGASAGAGAADDDDAPPLYIFDRAAEGFGGEDTPLPPFLAGNVSLLRWAGAPSSPPARAWSRRQPAPPLSEPLLSTYPEPPNLQFFLGPPGTGAPAHFHNDAVNVLVHGEKEWLLLPPAAAVYSTQRAADLFVALAAGDGSGGGGGGGDAPPPQLCTQRAGDVFFVPRGWGHAVLNTETALGYAIEFATPLQVY